MDAKQIVWRFTESMSALMDILLKENETLKSRNFKDLDALQSRKTQLAKGYAEAQGMIERDFSVFEVLSSDERLDLKKMYKVFRNVLSENMLALRGAHDATDRVVKLIIDAVKDQRGVKTAPLAFGPRANGYSAYSNLASASIALSTDS